jgi:hypothetical protein
MHFSFSSVILRDEICLDLLPTSPASLKSHIVL